ncbi:MFS transporter [Sulfobacillus sp. DSM 109850]|uniref:MFS transporter n=1 Tax=Sulfobacillus harzensis TaxID=2729629 RepID=A0A7Y0L1C0_9FIRM|nr:MFS transporter [Sulfobacillus harzensis]NMP21473.1 MFS transporter [Sulfobacillus harzensis]
MKHFPPAVWATAFATFVAFMGIGVVDPILPLIGREMGASHAQVEWLFTSYIAVMALAMLVSGVVGTRLGGKKTMLLGLGLVVVFATLSGLSPSIGFLATVRGGWGLGNAFFTSTALSIIVGLSTGGMGPAITLYEAALGLGIATGPLLGGLLGSFSWRYPFFGTATLMAIGFVATLALVREPPRREAPRTARDIFRALAYPAVLVNALIGLSYSYAFFTILAYSPLTLPHLSAISLGLTYFAWGVLVAFSSVVVVNWLLRRMHPLRVLVGNLACLTLLLVLAGSLPRSHLLVIIVVTGFFCGISNAVFTTLAMEVSPFARSISSGAYNFLRWAGAAIAPALSGWVGQTVGLTIPFYIAAGVLLMGTLALIPAMRVLGPALEHREQEAVP